MECLQARIDTFYKSRRGKQNLGRSASGNAPRWPHPMSYQATPRTLAEAGFYLDPGPHDLDNVTCFMCEKQLNDWEPEDDPFELHWRKCGKTCAWAMVRCGVELEKGDDGQYHFADAARLPASKAMEKARLETFTAMKAWPHDVVKGHGANSKKMAKAGFVYTPGTPGDDSATCVYCGLALNGWDEDDDPTEEHRKRDNRVTSNCAFLHSSSIKPASKQPARNAVSKPPSYTLPPSSEDELAVAINSAHNSNASRAMRSSVNRESTANAKTPASGSKRSTRGTGTGSRETPLAGSEMDDTEASGSEAGRRVSKTKGKRKGTTAAKAQDRMQVVEEEEEGIELTEMVPPSKPKRGPGRPSKQKKAEAVVDVTDQVPVPAKITHARTRSTTILVSDSDIPQPQASTSQPRSRTKSTAKTQEAMVQKMEDEAQPAARGNKKKTRKGGVDDVASDWPMPAPSRAAKGSKISRSKKSNIVVSESESAAEILGSEEPETAAEISIGPLKTRAAVRGGPGPRGRVARKDIEHASDEAGYVTAEQRRELMEVDQFPAKSRAAKAYKIEVPPKPRKLTADSDVEIVSDVPLPLKDKAKRKSWRSPPQYASSDVVPDGATRKVSQAKGKSKVPPSRTSSMATSSSSWAKIVEISSDGDDDVMPPARSENIASGSKQGKRTEVEDSASRRSVQVLSQQATSTDKTKKARDEGVVSSSSSLAGHIGGAVVINYMNAPPSPPDRNHVTLVTPSPPPSPPPSTSPESRPGEEPDDLFAPFTPALATVPIRNLTSLSEEEAAMTIEQWIRCEIEAQYQQLKDDAERQLVMVREKAAEMRKIIQSLK